MNQQLDENIKMLQFTRVLIPHRIWCTWEIIICFKHVVGDEMWISQEGKLIFTSLFFALLDNKNMCIRKENQMFQV